MALVSPKRSPRERMAEWKHQANCPDHSTLSKETCISSFPTFHIDEIETQLPKSRMDFGMKKNTHKCLNQAILN